MRNLLLPLLVALAAPASADVCDDLWFTRNQIMDRAGYCFGSPLGRAMFDNSDCAGKQIVLDAPAQRLAKRIRTLERQLGCAVDAKRRRIDLPDMAIRWRLRDLPVADEHESGCIGWRETVTPLYAGRDETSGVVGRIEPGDNVRYGHWTTDDDGWLYVTVWSPNWTTFKSAGWLGRPTNEASCRNWAG